MGTGSPRASTAEAFASAPAARPDAGARSALRFFRGVLIAVALGVGGWALLAAIGYGVYLLAT